MLKRCNETPVIKKYSNQCLAGPLRVLTMQGSLGDAEQMVALKYLYSAAQCEREEHCGMKETSHYSVKISSNPDFWLQFKSFWLRVLRNLKTFHKGLVQKE